MSMKDYENYCYVYTDDSEDPRKFIARLSAELAAAEKMGWTKLRFEIEGAGLEIYGRRPPDPVKEAKARERRRKQYEKLKQEFEGA